MSGHSRDVQHGGSSAHTQHSLAFVECGWFNAMMNATQSREHLLNAVKLLFEAVEGWMFTHNVTRPVRNALSTMQ